MAGTHPATAAVVGFVRAGSGWRLIIGPAVYDPFIGYMLVIEDWLAIEFRDPRRPAILIPYLVLFFGSIVLMGAPMLRINKRLWAVTAATSMLLLGSMLWALSIGSGDPAPRSHLKAVRQAHTGTITRAQSHPSF